MPSKDPYTPLEYFIVSVITVAVPIAAGYCVHELIAGELASDATANIGATILALLLFAWLNVEQEMLTRLVHRLFFSRK